MKLDNQTPYHSHLFRSVIAGQRMLGSLLMRVTYDIVGERLRVAPEQTWKVSGPPWDGPRSSSYAAWSPTTSPTAPVAPSPARPSRSPTAPQRGLLGVEAQAARCVDEVGPAGEHGQHGALQLPHLRGGELVELHNLHPTRPRWTFEVPPPPVLHTDGRNGKLNPTVPVIHSLILEPDSERVSVVWRGAAAALRPYTPAELDTMPLRVLCT